METSLMTKVRKALLLSIQSFDAETARRLQSGELKFTEFDLPIKATVSGSGRQDLIDENTDFARGKIGIDKGRLPDRVNFAVGHIAVSLSPGTVAESDPLNVNFSNKIDTTNHSLALLNSTLRIKQDDNILLEKPVELLMSEATADKPRGAKGQAYELDNPIVLAEQKQIKVELEVPTGQTITDNEMSHISVYLIGVSTKRK